MPKSKRDKKVSLTKTSKKGMALKQQLVEDIRQYLNKYNNLFVFTIHNMRNGPLKELREEWNDSRFFFAKRKVMAIALGRTEAEEMQKNIHKVASHLVGQCGLLFTNRPKDQVVEWFQDFSKMEFAKSGFISTETVTVPAGPLSEFSFSLEPHLRSLGLPTQLEKGRIILRENFTVCTEGARLTPEQASILKLFGKQLAEFKVKIVCMWSKDGSFERFKVPKAAKQLTPERNSELQKKKKKMESKTPEPGNKTEEEITQLFDHLKTNETKISKENVNTQNNEKEKSTGTKSATKRSKKAAQMETEEEGMSAGSETLPKAEKVEESTDTKLNNKKSLRTPKSKTEEKVQEETSEKVSVSEVSSKLTTGTPRRSLRTPKPIKRTPEEKKQSVKKLTESNKKSAVKNTATKPARGTPRKSVSKKIFEEPEDVEMAE